MTQVGQGLASNRLEEEIQKRSLKSLITKNVEIPEELIKTVEENTVNLLYLKCSSFCAIFASITIPRKFNKDELNQIPYIIGTYIGSLGCSP